MQNFRKTSDRSVVYYSGDNGEVGKVELYYSAGSMSYLSGTKQPRGLWLSIRKVTLKQEGACRTESFWMFGDSEAGEVKFFVRELSRFSAKELEKAALHFDPQVVDYVANWQRAPQEANASMNEQIKAYRGKQP